VASNKDKAQGREDLIGIEKVYGKYLSYYFSNLISKLIIKKNYLKMVKI